MQFFKINRGLVSPLHSLIHNHQLYMDETGCFYLLGIALVSQIDVHVA